MNFRTFGNTNAPTLLLIPGLGVSYEIFLPLIRLTEEKFRIIAVEVDGFTLGKQTRFTSVDDQAAQVIAYVREHHAGHLSCAYGLSLGGKDSVACVGAQRADDRSRYPGCRAFITPARLAHRSLAVLPSRERLDLLPLDGVLEVRLPLPLLRCIARRVPQDLAVGWEASRVGWLQIRLY